MSQRAAAMPAPVVAKLTALRQSRSPKLLWVSHALGGGVARHLHELEDALAGRAQPLLLQPATAFAGIILSLPPLQPSVTDQPVRMGFRWPQDAARFRQWLDWLGVSRVHVHHLAGYPADMPQVLQTLGLPMDLTLHDHTIVGQGVAPNRRGRTILAGESLAFATQALAKAAERVIAPSNSLASAVSMRLPGVEILVRPHPEAERCLPYPDPQMRLPAPREKLRVLCLGSFTPEKGAIVLAKVARLAEQRRLSIEFLLLGRSYYPLPRSVRQLGPYRDAELAQLIVRHTPHILWLPAQVPETWSYTLSAGLQGALPLLLSDIGALPERVQGRPCTWLLNPHSSALAWLDALCAVHEQPARPPQQARWPQAGVTPFYHGGAYLTVGTAAGLDGRPLPAELAETLRLGEARQGSLQRLFAMLAVRMRRVPLAGQLLARAALRSKLKAALQAVIPRRNG